MAIKNLYKGVSTAQYEFNKSCSIRDVECVKQDLLNHIFTRKGERIKMYAFGTRISDALFEPMTEDLIETLRDDLEAVFNYDPRVQLLKLNLIPDYDNHTIIGEAILYYIELNLNDTLYINLQFQN